MKEESVSANLLNAREQEIVQRLADGLSDQRIADELFLSLNTIKWYNRQIYSKLGVKSRTQAIARVKELAAAANGRDRSRSASSPGIAMLAMLAMLPMQRQLFIGRNREIAEVKRLSGRSRLLTLTGAGGTGKTRLGLRVAAEVAEGFADGVYFVDLAPLSDHTRVAKTIAGVLGILENSSEPLKATLKRGLAQRELCLLIDNFEHVIEEAPLLSELLVAAPAVKMLVTSREPLHLAEEQEYPVPPLSLPDVEAVSIAQLMDSEAGLLFVRRAQMIVPSFEASEATAPVIAHICARLDGLPLAIELAAARSKLFSPQALLQQLDEGNTPLRVLAGSVRDVPSRQRTLRASIEWSYDLLVEDEKLLLTRMAVFHGGCSVEAIERVCGEGIARDAWDVVDALASLVDKNLVQQKEGLDAESRFVMLEMIHEYALERLKSGGEEAMMRRSHAEYMVGLAERAEPELRLAGYDYWTRRFELEQENVREVLEWSLEGGDVVLGVRLASALCLLWYGNGYHVEGSQWTQRFMARLDAVPLTYHPRFLLCAGHMAFLRDLDAGKQIFLRMLALARELRDRQQEAWALTFLGYTMVAEPQSALPIVEESLALFRELHDLPGIAQALNIMGEIARYNGDDDRAGRAYEECLLVARQTGETRRIVYVCQNLTFVALHAGDAERASDLGRQGLELARTMNNRLELAKALAAFAGTVGMRGQAQLAVRLLGASERAMERYGAFHQLNDKPEIDDIIAAVRAQLDEATFQAMWAQGRALALEEAVAQVLE